MTTTDTAVQNPVDTLRQAAQLMRANAEAAADGPWSSSLVWSPDSHATSGVYSHAHPTGTPESEVVASGRRGARGFGGIRDPRNARHIVSWQPPVALTVAAWLEAEAGLHEKAAAVDFAVRVTTDNDFRINTLESTLPQALNVARAYLEAAAR